MNKFLDTIKYFKEIAKIPRESGNEKAIAEYLVNFAKERNLYYKCDEYNNVLIKKKNCNKPPIIMQAHVDMVCEKDKDKQFDFDTDSIEVIEENGYLTANGTTLGADNGIGVAQILAILDSDILCNVEAVFTVSEETTMIGAMKFDVSNLEGKAFLCLDGFEENAIILESACFYDIILETQYVFKNIKNKNAYEINISGLPGGHSGFDIDKGSGNSNIELAKILLELEDVEIIDFSGGTKFNVIPSQARAKFYTNLSKNEIEKICEKWLKILKYQYREIEMSVIELKTLNKALDSVNSKDLLETIAQFPHGVCNSNQNHEVTTSINLGVVELLNKNFKVGVRSSRKSEEKACIKMLEKYSKDKNLKIKIIGYQPGFESKKDGKLIRDLIKAHPYELFGRPPRVKPVHITVEAGIFQSKIPDIQIAIISPNIQGAHSINERVEIESIKRMDNWLINFLEEY